MNPAIILCERVLNDLMAETPPDLADLAEHHRGFLQTFAVRISSAVYSHPADDAYTVGLHERIGESWTVARSLVALARDAYGVEAEQAIAAACQQIEPDLIDVAVSLDY